MKNTGVFISLIDHETRKYLTTMVIPSYDIIPGEQYNLQIIFGDDHNRSSLYMSLIIQKSLTLQRRFYSMYPFLQTLEVIVNSQSHTSSITNVHLIFSAFCMVFDQQQEKMRKMKYFQTL